MPALGNLIESFLANLQHRTQSERQQAKIRIIIGLLVTTYIVTSYHLIVGEQIPAIMFYTLGFYLLAGLALFISTRQSPGVRPLRCIAGFTLDTVVGSILLMAGGAVTAWIYGGLMWVIIAYGLRFGKAYMFSAHVLAVGGFSLAIGFNSFWQTHMAMSLGLLFWLTVLPFYVAKLLDIMDTSIQKADIANRAKSRFLANMSHEIRTPLTAIIGYAESALDSRQDTPEHLNALSVIQRSGHHLLALINDILDFSKIEADEMDIEQIRINPFQILADVEAIASTQATRKGLRFDVNYQFPLPKAITSDPVRLRQILLNLCSNAIKFTQDGSVTVGIRYIAETNQLQCTVADTGMGIPPVQLEKIFQPFKQADSSTTRYYGGTGLGLSLSSRLTKLLGGQLDVDSQAGHGTCFTLTIPCGDTDDLVDSIQYIDIAKEQSLNTLPTGRIQGTILLAEDNITNQKLISALLKKMGAEVTTVENGQKAVTLATQHPYDLIYMDMQMPVMSGMDAVKALRQAGYQQAIVALTANATHEDKQMCLEAGCDDYVTKPVNIDRLHQVSARFLHAIDETQPSRDGIEPIYSELTQQDSAVTGLLDDFITELLNMMTRTKLAFLGEDWEEMREIMHDLKGMGGGFGYPQLSVLAAKLEAELKQKSYKDIRYLLNELDVMCQRIRMGKPPDSACA